MFFVPNFGLTNFGLLYQVSAPRSGSRREPLLAIPGVSRVNHFCVFMVRERKTIQQTHRTSHLRKPKAPPKWQLVATNCLEFRPLTGLIAPYLFYTRIPKVKMIRQNLIQGFYFPGLFHFISQTLSLSLSPWLARSLHKYTSCTRGCTYSIRGFLR